MATKRCKNCGQEVSTAAATYPNCGIERPAGGGARWKGWLKLGGIFVLGVFSGWVLFLFAFFVATDPTDNFALVEAGVRTGSAGDPSIVGTVRNQTDESYVQVRAIINLVDENGRAVGVGLASTDSLGAYETWAFETSMPAEAEVHLPEGSLHCTLRSATRFEPIISYACMRGGA